VLSNCLPLLHRRLDLVEGLREALGGCMRGGLLGIDELAEMLSDELRSLGLKLLDEPALALAPLLPRLIGASTSGGQLVAQLGRL
jgi:hypothetical protein